MTLVDGHYVERRCATLALHRQATTIVLLRQQLLPVAALFAAPFALGTGLGSPAAGGQRAATAKLTVTVRDRSEPPRGESSSVGRVTSRAAGIDCPRICVRNLARGRTVVLHVTIKAGFRFIGWAVYVGASRAALQDPAAPRGCRQARTCVLAIGADTHVVAEIVPRATLAVTTEGAGRVVVDPMRKGAQARVCSNDSLSNDLRYATIDLAVRLDNCVRFFPTGSRVTIRAIADTAVPGARFTGWSDYRCPARKPTCTLTMSGEHYLTAMFDPVFLEVVEGQFGPIKVSPSRPRCRFEADPASRGRRSCRVALPRNTRITLKRRSGPHQRGFWLTQNGPETTATCPKPGRGRRIVASSSTVCRFTLYASHLVEAGGVSVHHPGGVGELIRLEYRGPRGGRILIRSLEGGLRATCRRTCNVDYRHGRRVEIRAVSGGRARFLRWADVRARSTVRTVRIGTHNPVSAIFGHR
jgi:hypothetical protein